MALKDFFQQINSTSSIVEKEAILRKFKDDDFIAELLHRNLNPYLLFYIKKVPEFTQARPPWQSGRLAYKEFIQLTDKLKNREVTGKAALQEVTTFLSRTEPEEALIYKKILLKKAIGVGAKTVNKVWPNHIPEFAVMLAPSELPDVTKLKYPIMLQPKLDGYRCVYKDGAMYSRVGLPFGNKNLPAYFKKMFETGEYVLDGELYCHGTSFNKLQKILNNETAQLPSNLKFVIYDCIPLKEWNLKHSKKEYQYRLVDVRSIVNGVIGDHTKVIDIANDKVNSAAEVVTFYKDYLKKGYEGVMLKAPDGLYAWKRTTVLSGEILKLKPFETVDLEVKEIYDGKDDFEGVAGGVVVDFNGVAVRCGSGFAFDLREKMAKSPNDYIGKTVEIKYFEVTEEGSLRHPIFERFREEKD